MCSLPVSCFDWDNPALESDSGLYGRVNGDLQEDLHQRPPPRTAAAIVLIPTVNHSWTTGDPPTLAGGSGSVSYGITVPLHWVLACTRFYLCPSGMESMFPSILWKSYNQILLIFKVRSPGDFLSLCQILRLGALMWGLKPSQQWEKLFGIIVLQIVRHPPGRYGIWFYRILPHYHSIAASSCLWYGVSFLVGTSILLFKVTQQIVVIFVLS